MSKNKSAEFTTPGAFTFTMLSPCVLVSLIGGGAAGGATGGGHPTGGSGGGGSGEYAFRVPFYAPIGTVITGYVGAGGAPVFATAFNFANGPAGEDSNFGVVKARGAPVTGPGPISIEGGPGAGRTLLTAINTAGTPGNVISRFHTLESNGGGGCIDVGNSGPGGESINFPGGLSSTILHGGGGGGSSPWGRGGTGGENGLAGLAPALSTAYGCGGGGTGAVGPAISGPYSGGGMSGYVLVEWVENS